MTIIRLKLARGSLIVGFVLLVFTGWLTGDSLAADFSTPKSVAKSFYEALNGADSSAMRECLFADGADQQALAAAFVDLVLASKRMGDVAKDKFGAAGDRLGAGTISKEDAKRIDSAKQIDNGDEATLQIDPSGKPMKFHKTPAGWKLVVGDYAGAGSQTLPQQIKLLSNLASAMKETADEIAVGRFPTSTDAEAAIQQRFSEVMVNAYKPSTKPTSQPK